MRRTDNTNEDKRRQRRKRRKNRATDRQQRKNHMFHRTERCSISHRKMFHMVSHRKMFHIAPKNVMFHLATEKCSIPTENVPSRHGKMFQPYHKYIICRYATSSFLRLANILLLTSLSSCCILFVLPLSSFLCNLAVLSIFLANKK